MQMTLGFLGCGQMGGALLEGWLGQGLVTADAVRIADPATGPAWSARLGVASVGTQAMLDDADVVLLAVKPQVLAEVVAPLRFRPDQLVVSVVAGLSLSRVQGLCSPARVVRVMPNVACQVRAGATLLLTAGAAAEDVRQVAALFEAVGHVERLADERLFHAGTSVSGSGPAWIFMAMEALADGAVAAGLPRAAALRLAAHTVAGAGALAVAERAHPGELKDRVTSPGGTTIQGLRALEAGGYRAALIEAVLAATERSMALEAL
ncbi:MAG: pyrroline-5-carboxylate reductase [Myxococcales bacterium]|nr:pyrroline-5-carboxylate reductase [Myxococcales bacterium]